LRVADEIFENVNRDFGSCILEDLLKATGFTALSLLTLRVIVFDFNKALEE
jgi:hypothetical protein